jgi:hypothetical protein
MRRIVTEAGLTRTGGATQIDGADLTRLGLVRRQAFITHHFADVSAVGSVDVVADATPHVLTEVSP